ncbi:hypothetical protein GCM10008915_60140 [Bifidobacterium pullorum subsp. gallinarum]|jgi:hypothetical protein
MKRKMVLLSLIASLVFLVLPSGISSANEASLIIKKPYTAASPQHGEGGW